VGGLIIDGDANNILTLGDGTNGNLQIIFDGDGGTDGQIVYVPVNNLFNINQSILLSDSATDLIKFNSWFFGSSLETIGTDSNGSLDFDAGTNFDFNIFGAGDVLVINNSGITVSGGVSANASSTINSNFKVTEQFNASSTAIIEGLATFLGGVNINSETFTDLTDGSYLTKFSECTDV
jgi:hypothetical protein